MNILYLFISLACAHSSHDDVTDSSSVSVSSVAYNSDGTVNPYPGPGSCEFPDWEGPSSGGGNGPGNSGENVGGGNEDAGNNMPDIVCTTDVFCCPGNSTVCVGRNPWKNCKFCNCPIHSKDDWEKPEGNKTRIKDKYDTVKTASGKNPKFKEIFTDDSYYKNMTKDKRKILKKGLFRELRGQYMTFDKTNEDELDYDEGGFKVFKGFNKQFPDDLPFLIIDEPDNEDDPITVGINELFVFEDHADFKFKGRNFTGTTIRKDAVNGWHKTTFKDEDTGESCEIDGTEDDQTCKIDNTRFEVYFSGSAGAVIADVDCLSLDHPNNLGVEDSSGKKYAFNDIAYDSSRFFGFNLGTYTITDIPAAHPLGFGFDEHADNASLIEFVSCTGQQYKGVDSPMDSTTAVDIVAVYPNVDFCVGNMTITVHSDFNVGSTLCYFHGWMGGQHRVLFDSRCPLATPHPATEDDDDDDDDDNTAVIVGGVVGGLAFIGLALAGLHYSGLVKIFGRFDPIVNSHILNP